MFDRLFMPALTFTLLAAGFAAFASEIAQGADLQPQIVQLERVVVSAPRELSAVPLARAEADASGAVFVR
jgi:hypothetical protein